MRFAGTKIAKGEGLGTMDPKLACNCTGLVIASGAILLVAIWNYNKGIRKDSEVTDGDGDDGLQERNQQRLQQEEVERGEASDTIQQHLGATTDFTTCSDMGSRLQKNWFSVPVLVTVAPLSKNCVLNLDNDKTLKILNKILKQVKHPHLVQVLSVGYDSKSSHVIVTQFKQGASLRDLVYQETDPTRDWAEKYCSTGPSSQDSGHAHPKAGSGLIRKPRALPVEAVATYGRQILEAVVYLYDQGFPALGHIQTGNIFVKVTKGVWSSAQGVESGVGQGVDSKELDDAGIEKEVGPVDGGGEGVGPVDGTGKGVGPDAGGWIEDENTYCRLGGYENTLLGYRPRLYQSIVNAGELERIDVISFGHVMYEIGCGRELEGVCPTEAEYVAIKHTNFSSVLRKIFDHKKGVSEMLTWPFFADSAQPRLISDSKPLPHVLKAFIYDKYTSGKRNWSSSAVTLPFNLFRGKKIK